MLRYGITIFIVTASAICGYFLFAYKLDTIVLYDRAAAYTTIAPYFSTVPKFHVNKDHELSVVLSFEDVKEPVYLNNLEINVSPVNATPMLPVAVRTDVNGCEATSFKALPCNVKTLRPSTQDRRFTFTFNTRHTNTKRYLVTIVGDVVNGPLKSSFSKQIKIQEKAVFLERN
jgi:hypothetical protein